jgi:NADPH2:quinone reductase
LKAIVIHQTGGSEVLEYEEISKPTLMGGDLLICAQSIGINFIDVYHRQGVYPLPLPFTPGLDGAGIVEEIGDGVTNFAAGDLVAWPSTSGSYAEFVRVPENRAVKVPVGISSDTACAAMLQGMTAHYLINSTFKLQKNHTALIHAGAGGVGQLLLQMAKHIGATTITTVSSAEKAEIAKQAGADHVIRYDQENFADKVKEITGSGVDVVYDGVGKTTFDFSLASLKPRGMMALFGGASGQVPPFELQRLSSGGSLFITRPTLGHYIASDEELSWRAEEIFDLVAKGVLTFSIGATFKLEDAKLAHDALEARKTTGKIILKP